MRYFNLSMSTKSSDQESSDSSSPPLKQSAERHYLSSNVSPSTESSKVASRKRSNSDLRDDNDESPSQKKHTSSIAKKSPNSSELSDSLPQKRICEMVPVKPSKVGLKSYEVNDVISGRGGGTNRHEGNRFFRVLIESNRDKYLRSKKNDKPGISMSIVRAIRERNGRFLRKDEDSKLWFEIGDAEAREKTSQALRQRAPEYKRKMMEKDAQQIEAIMEKDVNEIKANLLTQAAALEAAPQQALQQAPMQSLQQATQQQQPQLQQPNIHQLHLKHQQLKQLQQLQLQDLQSRVSQHQMEQNFHERMEHQLHLQQMQIQQLQLQLMQAQHVQHQPVIPSILSPSSFNSAFNPYHQMLMSRNPHQLGILPPLPSPQSSCFNPTTFNSIPHYQIQLQEAVQHKEDQKEKGSRLKKRRMPKK